MLEKTASVEDERDVKKGSFEVLKLQCSWYTILVILIPKLLLISGLKNLSLSTKWGNRKSSQRSQTTSKSSSKREVKKGGNQPFIYSNNPAKQDSNSNKM